jgi:hypothetical protein
MQVRCHLICLRYFTFTVINHQTQNKTCLTAAQDRKGLTLSSIQHEVVLSAILPVHINVLSAVCVMLQCFPPPIISKFKPIVALKHTCRCNLILVLWMKRILFYKNEIIET